MCAFTLVSPLFVNTVNTGLFYWSLGNNLCLVLSESGKGSFHSQTGYEGLGREPLVSGKAGCVQDDEEVTTLPPLQQCTMSSRSPGFLLPGLFCT